MIHSIKLHNFQSHKNTLLEFSSGVNTIIGRSDSGKSSIFRGLFWAKDNRPSGTDFVSFWNRDEKNNLLHNTYVKIKTDNGSITRLRGEQDSADFNGYKINSLESEKEIVLNSIGASVPEVINKILNISDVNIQSQMDAPFLLSESAADVSRFFNKEIKLDLIDSILSKAESKRRETNRNISNAEDEKTETKRELEKLDWIEDAEIFIQKLEKLEDRIEVNNKKYEELEALIDSYKEQKIIIDNIFDFDSATLYIHKIEKIAENIKIQKRSKNQIEEYIENYEEQKTISEKCKNNVKKYEAMLPKSCPYCGKKL